MRKSTEAPVRLSRQFAVVYGFVLTLYRQALFLQQITRSCATSFHLLKAILFTNPCKMAAQWREGLNHPCRRQLKTVK